MRGIEVDQLKCVVLEPLDYIDVIGMVNIECLAVIFGKKQLQLFIEFSKFCFTQMNAVKIVMVAFGELIR